MAYNPTSPTLHQSSILWPNKYLPGTTDNFVSNETIVSNLTASQIWTFLVDVSKWSGYYDNVSDITPPVNKEGGTKMVLEKGDKFKFSTFGFPALECVVAECVNPVGYPATVDAGLFGGGLAVSRNQKGVGGGKGGEGRLAWSARLDSDDEDESIDVYHAWLVEDLEGGRVRILTQESQIGAPAKMLAGTKPNKMLNGHQDWSDGLVKAARDYFK